MSPYGSSDGVGPVLESSPAGHAIVAAIRKLNQDVTVQDRGAYLRVLVPQRCLVTRRSIEIELGQPFRLPQDLEPLMPAFKGLLRIDADSVEWSFAAR